MQSYSNENVFTVSEINNHVKNVVENNIPLLYIEGEIANFVHHKSGHMYLSLKDDESSIRAVFFARQNLSLMFKPKNGDKVICYGKLTVYVKSGQYQLQISSMFALGKGKQAVEFEMLKQKLNAEGLFLQSIKKPIKKYPENIGIVTSKSGAALQDIKNVLARRMPVNVFVYHAAVQGKTSSLELKNGIEYFSSRNDIDTIIISRGGGSSEDLNSFNDEALARAIFACPIPVISGVGHEIDFTICDFVSDLRAPTPSAAAELAVADKQQVLENISFLSSKAKNLVNQKFSQYNMGLLNLKKRVLLKHPQQVLMQKQQELDFLTIRLNNTSGFYKPQKQKLNHINSLLKELHPLKPFEKGFALIYKSLKHIKSATELQKNDEIEIKFADGTVKCKVENKELK